MRSVTGLKLGAEEAVFRSCMSQLDQVIATQPSLPVSAKMLLSDKKEDWKQSQTFPPTFASLTQAVRSQHRGILLFSSFSPAFLATIRIALLAQLSPCLFATISLLPFISTPLLFISHIGISPQCVEEPRADSSSSLLAALNAKMEKLAECFHAELPVEFSARGSQGLSDFLLQRQVHLPVTLPQTLVFPVIGVFLCTLHHLCCLFPLLHAPGHFLQRFPRG